MLRTFQTVSEHVFSETSFQCWPFSETEGMKEPGCNKALCESSEVTS